MKIVQKLFLPVLLLFIFLFMGLPLFTVTVQGLAPSIIIETLSTPFYQEGLINSLKIALCTTVLVVIIALPPAILYDRFEFRGKSLVNVMMMVPMILPPFVGALGFQQVFGYYGVLNAILGHFMLPPVDWLGGQERFGAVCLIEALHLYPLLYLNLVTALANIDPSLDEAARNLGAGRWRRFRRVTLPLIRPGMFAGGSIVLIWSFTELGTPLMLGYDKVTTVQIFNGINELETNPVPYALVVLLLIFSAGIYSIVRATLGRVDDTMVVKGMSGKRLQRLSLLPGILVFGVFLVITLAAGLPHMALLLGAFSQDWYGTILPSSWTMLHFKNSLSHEIVVPSIINSLKYSSLAMLVCLGLGIPAALLLVRRRPRYRHVIDTLIMLPLAVPGIVVAFGYLGMCSRYQVLNYIFDPVNNPTLLLVMAYAIRRLPYVVRSACAGLEQTPVSLEEAARNLGAGGLTVLRRITVPLVSANLVVGALFAFSFSMLEVSDSLILAQKSIFYPVTKAIFELSQILGEGTYIACAFGVWAMLFLAFSLLAANLLLGRKMGSLFRF